ncbi:hypothetical protein RRG08_013867 [Elysia crispata]|uniref:Uncharacterized protein n=1 Tax=Elysia crispata TaxID=231223 RepID=A0AAE0YM24_9GAST|nr:hypothetical protein RRG08_013867 [Elysia crispata]
MAGSLNIVTLASRTALNPFKLVTGHDTDSTATLSETRLELSSVRDGEYCFHFARSQSSLRNMVKFWNCLGNPISLSLPFVCREEEKATLLSVSRKKSRIASKESRSNQFYRRISPRVRTFPAQGRPQNISPCTHFSGPGQAAEDANPLKPRVGVKMAENPGHRSRSTARRTVPIYTKFIGWQGLCSPSPSIVYSISISSSAGVWYAGEKDMVHPFHAPERTRRRTFLTRKSLNLSGNWVGGGGGGGVGEDGGIREPVNLFPVPGRVQGDSQLLHLHGDGEDGVPTLVPLNLLPIRVFPLVASHLDVQIWPRITPPPYSFPPSNPNTSLAPSLVYSLLVLVEDCFTYLTNPSPNTRSTEKQWGNPDVSGPSFNRTNNACREQGYWVSSSGQPLAERLSDSLTHGGESATVADTVRPSGQERSTGLSEKLRDVYGDPHRFS